MTDHAIPNALSDAEWAEQFAYNEPIGTLTALRVAKSLTPEQLFADMALTNAALPDGDQRKITRDHVAGLLFRADREEEAAGYHGVRRYRSTLRDLADILAAILPPEAP